MRHVILWLLAIAVILLFVTGAYLGYGRPGAITAACAVSVILFVIWIDRTA
jgi:hypothetical protein